MYRNGITIVIPAYNAEKTIERCLNSIIAQTYQNWFIIIIDDGSQDRTNEICMRYSAKYKNIKVIRIDNSGVSIARNTGIKSVETEYFVCIDSDDWVEPEYLKSFVDAKTSYPICNNIWCCFKTIEKENETFKNYLARENELYSCYSKQNIMDLHNMWLAQMPWHKLYKTCLVIEASLQMDVTTSLGEDLMFNLDYIDVTNNDEIVVINKALYNYDRTNETSLDHRFIKNRLEAVKKIINKYSFYLSKWKVAEDQMNSFYNFCFYSYETVFKNNMRKENKVSFISKIRTNNKLLRSDEFKIIIKKRNCFVHPLLLKAYNSKQYILVMLFESLAKIKNNL